MRRAGVLWLASACSFTPGTLPDTSVNFEAGVVDDTGVGTVDASDSDAGPCTFSEWSMPQRIAELSIAGGLDARPRLNSTETIVVFYSNRTGGLGDRDIYTATRATRSDPFTSIANLTTLNTTTTDRDAAISGDGLNIVFASTRGGNLDMYASSRLSATAEFAMPSALGNLNTSGQEYFLSLSHDGLTVYFSSDRGGGLGGPDIWYATRPTVTSSFGNAMHATALSSAAGDYCTAISADGLEMYLSSDRGGTGIDIYVSTRALATDAFSNPVRVAELSFTGEDHPGWLSPDRLRFYYSNQSSGSSQLYMATRTCN